MNTLNVIHGTYTSPAGYWIIGDDGEPLGDAYCIPCMLSNMKHDNAFASESDIPVSYTHLTLPTKRIV